MQMAWQGKLYQKLKNELYQWLKQGEATGFIDIQSTTVALSSVLGKRTENQDRVAFLRIHFETSNKPSIAALVLCDGMGGMVDGGDCATLAISEFIVTLVHNNASKLSDKLRTAAMYANDAVYAKFQGNGGSTLSAVACNEQNEWAAVNVGDSRIYQMLENGKIEQITVDDTLEKQLADMNLASPPPEFRQLLQFVGMGEEMELRHIQLKPISEVKWFVITSDGAHSIPDSMFQSLIYYSEQPKEAATRLTQLSEWLGGKDNSTVAILNTADTLFNKSKGSTMSDLEVWGISGQVNFFMNSSTMKNSQNSTLTRKAAQNGESVQQEESQPYKEDPRKKSATRTEKRKVKNPHKKDHKNGLDKPAPQLNIEFSEES
jgi:serine/threonine protein phosphatase PrpC